MARPATIFQGDDDSMVDRLIEACQSAKSASPTRPELIGRELVAVDCAWLDVPLPAHVAVQYERPNNSCGNNGQRKPSNSAPGSPGRGSKACSSLKASSVPSPASSTASGHSTKKSAGRANSAKLASAASPGSPVRSASARMAVAPAAAVPAKRQPQAQRGHAAARNNSMPIAASVVGANTAPSSPRNTSPACPGHFRSPQPHLLPVPTSSLLLKAATSNGTLLAEVKLPRFGTHDGELSHFLASQTVPPAAA